MHHLLINRISIIDVICLNYEISVIKKCKDHEMDEFPKRMRNWLYLIMEELVSLSEVDFCNH